MLMNFVDRSDQICGRDVLLECLRWCEYVAAFCARLVDALARFGTEIFRSPHRQDF